MSFILKDRIAARKRAVEVAKAAEKLEASLPEAETAVESSSNAENADVKAALGGAEQAKEPETAIQRMKRLAAESHAKHEEHLKEQQTSAPLQEHIEKQKEASKPSALSRLMAKQKTQPAQATEEEPAEEVEENTNAQDTSIEEPAEVAAKLPAEEAPRKLTLAERIAARKKSESESIQSAPSVQPEAVISTPKPVQDTESASSEPQPATTSASIPATVSDEEIKPERKLSLRERIALRKSNAATAEDAVAKATAVAIEQTREAIQRDDALWQNDAQTKHSLATTYKVEETPIKGAPQVHALTEAVQDAADNRKAVVLNEKQRLAVDTAKQRKSMVLIGKAGSGKTTSVREIVKWLITPEEEGGYGIPRTADFKKQNGSGTKDRTQNNPRLVVASFTKRAVANIKNSCIQAMPELEVTEWCFQSLHNAAEYAPEYYMDIDDEGNEVKKMRFAPQKHPGNLIEADFFIVEEASMVGTDLWDNIMRALPDHCVIIFLGDICQLPPVFGMPVLIYAMAKLPVVELTQIYRTKMGPVLNGAHNILEGKMPEFKEGDNGSLRLYMPWKNEAGKPTLRNIIKEVPGQEMTYGDSKLAVIYDKLFAALYKKGEYDPEQDMILSPFNKGALGTKELNKCIAQFVGAARDAEVYEILAGYEKHYLAVGDKVMVDKQDGIITAIRSNMTYMGSMPQPSGTDLTRFGVRIIGKKSSGSSVDIEDLDDYAHFSLDAMAEIDDDDAAKHAASHAVEVLLETGQTITLDRKGDFNGEKFSLGYVLTGHKSQGSEFRNTYIIMHKSHHTLLSREWLYTTMTRTKVTCTLLANPYSVEKCLGTQRIAGDTVEEKLAWFMKDVTDLHEVVVCPSERQKTYS